MKKLKLNDVLLVKSTGPGSYGNLIEKITITRVTKSRAFSEKEGGSRMFYLEVDEQTNKVKQVGSTPYTLGYFLEEENA